MAIISDIMVTVLVLVMAVAAVLTQSH